MTYILSLWIFKEKSYICIKTSCVFVGTLKYIDVETLYVLTPASCVFSYAK